MGSRALLFGVAALMGGCIDLLGGDGVPVPLPDAGLTLHLPPLRDAGRDQSAPGDAEAGLPAGYALSVSSAGNGDVESWCAVTAAGIVECWGANLAGQLGNGTRLPSTTPVQVTGLTGATAVSVGNDTACALTGGGGVWCWGYGQDGELGNGTTTDFSVTPVEVSGVTNAIMLSAGDLVTCIVEADGSVWCWGDADGGELGNGLGTNSLVPTEVTGLTSGATNVSAGGSTGCAVVNGGAVCWGAYDGFGELGNGTSAGSPSPVPVTGLTNGVVAVTVGDTFACALTTAGGVMCWGEGDMGELGNGELADSPVPVQVTGLTSGVVSVSAGQDTACAVKMDGTTVCWGVGTSGALGDNSIADVSGLPVDVMGIASPAVAVSTGGAPCVTTRAGTVECWGFTSQTVFTPVPVTNLATGAVSVSLGGDSNGQEFACAVATPPTREEPLVTCWGANVDGQLGTGTNISTSLPVTNFAAPTIASAVVSGAAADFACALDSGEVLCWGDNTFGQLGNGMTISSPTAVSVVGLTDAVAVSVGHFSACALTSAGAVVCWGDNTYGELGNNSTTASFTPTPVQGLTSGVTSLSVGIACACAILADGTVECWGNNTSGIFGNGTTTDSNVPVPVTGLTDVASVAIGWYSACAVTTSGAIDCWGDNYYGELGTGSPANASLVPAAVSGIAAGATEVSVGQQSACAIVSGTAWCWGMTALGDGPNHLASGTPVQVSTLPSDITSIAAGLDTTCAVSTSLGVECWGTNSAGQLGDGALANDLTATMIVGFP